MCGLASRFGFLDLFSVYITYVTLRFELQLAVVAQAFNPSTQGGRGRCISGSSAILVYNREFQASLAEREVKVGGDLPEQKLGSSGTCS